MKLNLVVMGGGTGTFTVLRGLKEHTSKLNLTALMTMADDGGSNKILRDEFGLLPTSGIRQAIVALSQDESLMRELFTYRYYQGTGISGMTFGNLFMAALADILQSQKRAIAETCRLMKVQGKILPISYDDVRLLAEYQNGQEVLGEHLIDEASQAVARQRIVKFRTVPKAKIDPDAARAIQTADFIILGPGDLYTNTIANLVVEGVVDNLIQSKAKLIFVMNLMTKLGETYAYQAKDFLDDLGRYLPIKRLDFIIINNNFNFPPNLLKNYQLEGAEPVKNNLSPQEYPWLKIIETDLISSKLTQPVKGDKIKRSMIRHHHQKLAQTLISCMM